MKELSLEFEQRFHRKPEYLFFCPGRVNLIGEHIDYNGGQVMPCAISLGTYVAIAGNNEHMFRFQCLNFAETASLPVQTGYQKKGPEWFYYPLGVIDAFLQAGRAMGGLDLLFYGDLPVAAGLSSSASIEVLTAFALNNIFGYGIPTRDLAILAKKVENEFIGVNCGIMDQFAVAMGKASHAILLNCDTIDYSYIPFDTRDYTLAIINSNKQRSLAESKYNERFAQCQEALRRLRRVMDAGNLCEISPAQFERHRNIIGDPLLEKRALHVISENERVNLARQALEAGDLQGFGKLMYASHDSLSQLYEVSGAELDLIVDYSRKFEGCIGARMTGAGFGGCAIALVKTDRVSAYSAGLVEIYRQQIGYVPEVFASAIGDGVKAI